MLVYKDGDRVQGRLLRQEDNILVFQSDRFGVLQVPTDVKPKEPKDWVYISKHVPRIDSMAGINCLTSTGEC